MASQAVPDQLMHMSLPMHVALRPRSRRQAGALCSASHSCPTSLRPAAPATSCARAP